MTIIKTEKDCKWCKKTIEIGSNVDVQRITSPYTHYEFRHIECAIKWREQGLNKHIETKAPKVILQDYREVIEKLKKEVISK